MTPTHSQSARPTWARLPKAAYRFARHDGLSAWEAVAVTTLLLAFYPFMPARVKASLWQDISPFIR